MRDVIRILLVDDNPESASRSKTTLKRYEPTFHISSVHEAEEVYSAITDDDIDCIVSEFALSGIDGLELLHRVREYDALVPFILFTAHGGEEVASQAISGGVTDYVRKGGSQQFEVLVTRIKHAIDARQLATLRSLMGQNPINLFDQLPDPVFSLTSDWSFSYLNEAASTHFGQDRETMIGSSIWETVPEVTETTFFDRYHEAMESDHPITVTEYFEPWDRWYREYLYPSVDGLTVLSKDITAGIERQEERKALGNRYQAIFNDPNILVLLLDVDGTVIEINETALSYLDEPIEEVVGKSLWETTWIQNGPDGADDVIERVRSGEYVEFEPELSNQTGESYILRGAFRPVHDADGTVQSILISARDVSDRRHRERELHEMNRRLTSVLEATQTGLWEWELESDAFTCNETLLTLLSLNQGDVAETMDGFQKRIHPEDHDRVAGAVTEARTVDLPFHEELRLRDATGSYRWFEVRGDVLDARGDQTFAGLATDITARREREAQLQTQRDRFEEFASIIAHDLGDPLTVAQGRIALFQDTHDQDHLIEVERALSRAQDIVTELGRLTRHGAASVDPEDVSLAEVANEAWLIIRPESASLRVEDRRIIAEPSLLQGLFENLFRNAIDHGGHDVHVRVGSIDGGFFVEDTGDGVQGTDVERIFEHGFSGNGQGTGIGLTVVKRIADAHNWEIAVTESGAGGARFEFTNLEE